MAIATGSRERFPELRAAALLHSGTTPHPAVADRTRWRAPRQVSNSRVPAVPA